MKKRLLALLLALVLTVSLLPMEAWAADSVTVNFTAQAEGAFLFAPQFDVQVSANLAESYGYTDAVTGDVSALDVLVKAHEVIFDSDFTGESKGEYLVVQNGSIKKMFGTETNNVGFIINGGFPNDGVKGANGYGGYTVNQAPVTDGDFVEFLIYQDEYAMDNIVWFCKDGTAIDSLTVTPGSETVLTLKGLYYGWYGSNYADANAMHTQGGNAICGMQLAWVDVDTGGTTDIPDCITDEADGTVTLTASSEGTYYLTVTGTDVRGIPAIMSLTKVIVDSKAEPTPVASCNLTALSVTDLTGDAVKELTPSFRADVTGYTTAVQDYSTNATETMFKVLVTADKGATVTAKLGEADVAYNEYMGGFVFNGGNTLKPGNNVVTVTVTNGGESKTYTVTIPMKDEGGNAPAPDPDPEPSPEPGTDAAAVMDAIAAKYAASGIASDGQAPWLAADMAAYAMAFPSTDSKLSDAQKQEYLDKLIPLADTATKPGDLAKYIIAFRSMGYDARKVVTANGQTVDVVKKLTDLVDEQASTVTNQYALPYVIIALQQGGGYATDEQLAFLKQAAVSSKASWQNTQWDTDGATPMILALSPYYGESDIKAVVDEAIAVVKGEQTADGSTGNAASTGLTMAAMAAVGVDCAAVKAEGSDHSLVDGLMTQVTAEGNGFNPTTTTFATEQGFRGLVAAALQKKANGPAQVYSFRSMPMNTARVSAENCPVEFSVVPDGAAVEVKLGDTVQSPKSANYYDLAAGSYTYTVSKTGYRSASGSFEVTSAEANAHTKKDISVSLISAPAAGEGDKELKITVKVLTHDGDACQGKWNYKENSDRFTPIVNTTVTVISGQTVFDAFALAMEQAVVHYTEKTIGYISEIDGQVEFGHGSANSGWQYMVGSTLPTVGCRDYTLSSNVTVTWFYTDDYTREKDSDKWSGGGSSGGTPATPADETETTLNPEVEANASGEAAAAISEDALKDTIADAKTGKADTIVIAPEVKGDASKVSVELPKSGVDAISKQTDADLKVETGIADITIPQKSLDDLTGQSGSKVTISAEAVKDTDEVKLEIAVDDKPVGKLAGGITVSVPAKDGNSGNVLVIVNSDGSETIVKKSIVDGKTVEALLDGSCTVKVVDNSKQFSDTADHWSKDAVAFASAHELLGGTGENTFSPDASMSRAMLATVLYRLEDAAVNGSSTFPDVAEGTWFTDAVTWASSAGIVTGTGSGFDPNGNVTREQLATMLYRYARTLGMSTGAPGAINGFSDGGKTSGWAREAMEWAVGSGLISGKGNGILDPTGSATRAEVAVIMQRLIGLMMK